MRKKMALVLVLCAPLLLCGAVAYAGSEQGDLCSNGIDDDGDGLVDCDDRDCRQECASGGGGGGEFLAEGAVGHSLTCLPCSGAACVVGDFYDLGTVDNGCELLTCGSGNGQNLVCGRNADPQPMLDISGLYGLWGGGGQGDPNECFGAGVVESKVHTADQRGAGDIEVYLFFSASVDGTLPGRCSGATDLVRYVVDLVGCTPSGTYPPGVGEITTVECAPGTVIDIKTEGGGGIAKKCGCTVSGVLAAGVDIEFRGQ